MAPRGHTSRRGPFGLHLHPVRTWWPGKGTPFSAPSARVFYTSKVRAKLGWWQAERASRAVVQCLQHGYKLQFDTPPPPFKTSPLLVDAKDVDFALQDLQQGDTFGAYQPLLPDGHEFLSRTRVHTQPNGKQRTVHNYRRINSHARKATCRYESVRDLPALLAPNHYLLSCDCEKAFWSIPLHKRTAHFLSFHFALPERVVLENGGTRFIPLQLGAYWVGAPGSPGRYQVVERSCAALPFGYTNSPWVWTKVIKVLGRAMRAQGIKCLWFLDDCLLCLPSKADAYAARDFVELMFQRSGLTRAPDKGQFLEPTHQLDDHLGFIISTHGPHGFIKVPARRCVDIAGTAKDLLCRSARDSRRVPSHLLRSFLGKVSSIGAACDQARLRLRSLHNVAELWLPTSVLDRPALRDLQFWADFKVDSKANGLPLWPDKPSRAIYTDASSTLGFGAVLEAPLAARKTFGGWWDKDERQLWHITMKELVAVRLGIVAFAQELRNRTVLLWEDNQAVVFILRNRTSSSSMLMAELRVLLALLEDLNIRLVPRYIRSALNKADEFSRLTDRDAWTLRPHVQRMLMRRALAILKKPCVTLDPFACHQSRVCSRFASRLFHPEALALDGSALNWRNDVVWINPPWALLPDIIGKIECERPDAILIVPKWTSQLWWPRLLALGGVHIQLPPPKYSVHALHHRVTEPFLHQGLQLVAVVLKRGMQH